MMASIRALTPWHSRSLGTMQENSKLDLESIISKLLMGVSPHLLWCTQRSKIEWKRLRREQTVGGGAGGGAVCWASGITSQY